MATEQERDLQQLCANFATLHGHAASQTKPGWSIRYTRTEYVDHTEAAFHDCASRVYGMLREGMRDGVVTPATVNHFHNMLLDATARADWKACVSLPNVKD